MLGRIVADSIYGTLCPYPTPSFCGVSFDTHGLYYGIWIDTNYVEYPDYFLQKGGSYSEKENLE
jgi:hypothetical protein